MVGTASQWSLESPLNWRLKRGPLYYVRPSSRHIPASNPPLRGCWVVFRLLDERQDSADPGAPAVKINFFGVVPESQCSGRNMHSASVFPAPADGAGARVTRGELRLCVLNSLPQTHQRYLFEEIHKLCRNYLRNQRIPPSEITPEELVSEIWQKLLGTVSLPSDAASVPFTANPSEWSIDPRVPECDGRVVWLIKEIGGPEAIAHRREDILRQRFGRSLPGRGRPIVQPESENEPFEIGYNPGEPTTLEEADARRVLRGLLATASLEFAQDDDISMLLRLMADDPDILENSSARQWPMNKIVDLLNVRFPPPSWSSGRVDNAKRRLVNWINRLMRNNGLDATDLEGLFARVTRRQEGTLVLQKEARPPALPS
jgi:hypothetical protein